MTSTPLPDGKPYVLLIAGDPKRVAGTYWSRWEAQRAAQMLRRSGGMKVCIVKRSEVPTTP